MNFKTTKLKIVSASVLALIGSLFPATTLAAGPVASATCKDTQITITMQAPANHSHFAIRIDDRSNSYQPTDMRPGDVLIDNHASNTFTVKGQAGELYNWWIHSIARDGTWSEATGGTISCSPKKPVNLRGTYNYPVVTISWNPVPNAVRYAIRVDNTVNPWTPDAMQEGDHLRNNHTETTFTHRAARDRKVVFWVHAIDKYGNWSEASWGHVYTK